MLFSSAGLDQFHESLIGPTVRNARKTLFYRGLYSGLSCDRLADLADLPLVTKIDLVRAGADARILDGQIVREVHTGGTTGLPFRVAVGEREAEALAAFYTSLFDVDETPLQRRGIRFADAIHPFSRVVPTPVRWHDMSIYSANSFEWCREILDGRFGEDRVEPHCSLLFGGERILRAFADWILDRAPGGLSTSLSAVGTSGSFLTASTRYRIEQAFGARVLDRYALTEVTGGATQSARCGWYFFDPTLIAEVVDAGSGEPIREGTGIVVVTPLYPFQEAQPLLRYRTGDVAEVTHSRSSIPGRIAIRPLGRESSAVWNAEDGWLLTPDILVRIFDDCPLVARPSLFLDARQIVQRNALGFASYVVSSCREGARTRITIEAMARDGSGACRKQLADHISHGLDALAPHLSRAAAKGKVVIEIHCRPPN